jgi:hypothetical protein
MLYISQENGKTGWTEICLVLAILLALAGIGIILTGGAQSEGTATPAQHDKLNPAEPLIPIPKGVLPQRSPEIFNPDNLYEKIDGQADLYLSAGFQRLKSQSLVKADKPDLWVDLFVYDMGNALNAFAVFSMQRREECESVKLGQFSCSIEGALFLVHGPYYLEIIASMVEAEASEMMHSIAEDFVCKNHVEVKPIAELSQFPRSNLIENSITLIPSNAFGYDGLDRIFTGHYSLGGKKVTAFISRRESLLKAEELALKYHAFLLTYGGKDVKPGIRIKNAKVVKIAEAYEVIFTHGSYLAGVHEATDKAQAESLADMVHKRLEATLGKH